MMMAWWGWLLLVLWMVAILIAGMVYVFTRGVALMHIASSLGSAVSNRLDQSHIPDPRASEDERPIFTEPLQVAGDRYAAAHARVLGRRRDARRRHRARWEQWSRFNS